MALVTKGFLALLGPAYAGRTDLTYQVRVVGSDAIVIAETNANIAETATGEFRAFNSFDVAWGQVWIEWFAAGVRLAEVVDLLDLSVGAIADVLAEVASGMTPQQFWEYVKRTLTQDATTAVNTQQGGIYRIVSGDDYGTDGRQLLFVRRAGCEWPIDLNDYTWAIVPTKAKDNTCVSAPDTIVAAVDVNMATGDSRSFLLACTATATADADGMYNAVIRGTKVSDSSKWAPIICQLRFLKDQIPG